MSYESKLCSSADAAQRVRTRDRVALPLGPGQPPAFLRALGERDDFEDLCVFSALLIDLFPLFAKKGVKLRSGFFGPVERALRAAGHRVEFVAADFRRFAQVAREFAPRVMATVTTPPDASGWMSLSLHAGATVEELRRCGADPERVLVVEVNPKLPRTFGIEPEFRHALHVDEADLIIESELDVFTLADAPTSEIEDAIAKGSEAVSVDAFEEHLRAPPDRRGRPGLADRRQRH